MPGTFMRARPIMPRGMFLSQPPITTTPSIHWPCTQGSIQSAITSRDTSEYFMASVPIDIPSEIVGDADHRLVEIFFLIADGVKHRTVRRACDALRDVLRTTVVRHGDLQF